MTATQRKPSDDGFQPVSEKWSCRRDRDASLRKRGFGADMALGRNELTGEKVLVKMFDYALVQVNRTLLALYPNWRDFKYRIAHESRMHFAGRGHPNILQALDTVYDDEAQKGYIILEYQEDIISLAMYLEMHADTLAKDAVKDSKRNKCDKRTSFVRERFSKEITRQLVSAVGYLHKHFIAHRDITLDNIYVFPAEPSSRPQHHQWSLNNDVCNQPAPRKPKKLFKSPLDDNWTAPRIKLGHLGRSSLFLPGANEGVSRERVGSNRAYYAPEMMERAASPGGASDIWAIAVVTQLLATLEYPAMFTDKTVRIRLAEKTPWMSKDMVEFLVRTLIRSPWRRAPISEVATHPWLSNLSRLAPSDNSSRIKLCRMYGPVDFHVPMRRRQEIIFADDLDSNAVEEACQGYWGWLQMFGAEEMLPERITDAAEKYSGQSLMDGFKDTSLAVYLLAKDYMDYVQADRDQQSPRPSVITLAELQVAFGMARPSSASVADDQSMSRRSSDSTIKASAQQHRTSVGKVQKTANIAAVKPKSSWKRVMFFNNSATA